MVSRGINRRRFLAGAAGVVGLAGIGAFTLPGLLQPGQPGRQLTSRLPLPRPYQRPLPIPPVLGPTRSDPGVDYYEITQRVSDQEIIPGTRTAMWTYGGSFPGPTIVSRSGRRAVIRHRNELPQPSVVHLHGGHTPHDSDGYPTDLVLPVGSSGHLPMSTAGMPGMPEDPLAGIVTGERDYSYPLDQRAATLWYHDHRMGFTAAGMWRGLAGFHLVHDDEELALPLPSGPRDIPLMITDRAFAVDGALLYPAVDPTMSHTPGVTTPHVNGVTGDVILVNGVPWPLLEADAAHYRLRFLNASNARNYRVALDPPPPGGGGLVQIGSDGGLLAAPLAHDAIDIVPGQRFDVVVDFARYPAGSTVDLVNLLGTGTTAMVMRVRIGHAVGDEATVPARLATIAPLDPDRAAVTRTFLFQNTGDTEGWTINGYPFDPTRPDATVRLGDIEVWRFVTDFAHPIHLHLNHFQVLSRSNRSPGPYDLGWKDTVDLRPAEAVEIITRFTDHLGRFVFHCHNLEHEDMAMMANLVTV